jgi:D-xylose transport system substrate-binding protein
MLALSVVGVLSTASMAACTDREAGTGGGDSGYKPPAAVGGPGKVGVILPDTETSARWKNDDPKYLKAAFDQAGVPVDIKNAEGDEARFVAIADQMIREGAKVLVIANLGPDSGRTVIQHAHAAKIKTVDYDRLTLGGGADYYVSFDGVEVGRQQATELVKCLTAKKVTNPVVAELNGSTTDHNATLFKTGYDEVLQQLYDEAKYTKGPDQWVPQWKNDEGGRIFEQMFSQQPKIRGVLAPNDGIAGAVIEVLKKHKLNGRIPVTGQDATVEGLRNVLTGDQCMTVYKAIRPEAEAAAKVATSLYRGKPPAERLGKIKDPESGAYVPFRSLNPLPITKANINTVIADKYVTIKELCAGKYAALCEDSGITLS